MRRDEKCAQFSLAGPGCLDPAPPTGVWQHLSASEVATTWPPWKSVAVARVAVAAILY